MRWPARAETSHAFIHIAVSNRSINISDSELAEGPVSDRLMSMPPGERDPRLREIGERIKSKRSALGLTQDQLASKCALSKSYLSELENGVASAAGLVYLRVAAALNVDISWLLTGAGATSAEPPARETAIPPLVAQLAYELDWPYRRTLEVADAVAAIAARRTTGGVAWQPSRDYLVRLAQAIAERDGE